MSLYITKAQFIEQCGPAFSGAADPIIPDACTWASTYADSFLRKRYLLPLISFDVDLTSQVFALVLWKVATQIGFKPGSGQNEVIRMQYDDALAWFSKVSLGQFEPHVTDQTPNNIGEEGPQAASDCPINFQQAGVTGRRGGGWGGGTGGLSF